MPNFIKTSFTDTAEQLRAIGFCDVQSSDGKYTFINDIEKLKFNDDVIDRTKIKCSNMLCIQSSPLLEIKNKSKGGLDEKITIY